MREVSHQRSFFLQIELRTSTNVTPLISRSAEGVFTNVTLFNATDQYVLYYHSGHKTIRVFRYSMKSASASASNYDLATS